MKRRTKVSLGMYASIFLLLLLYLFVPSVYSTLSHALFAKLYRYNLPEWTPTTPLYTPEGALRLQVLARPPQTPYDLVITSMLSDTEPSLLRDHYVYTQDGIPVGYVHTVQGAKVVVQLFSSTKSEEYFSVEGKSVKGKGEGGGGITLTLPLTVSLSPNAEVRHQATGISIGRTIAVREEQEKQLQWISTTLPVNPLELLSLYVLPDRAKRVTPEDLRALQKQLEEEERQEGEGETL